MTDKNNPRSNSVIATTLTAEAVEGQLEEKLDFTDLYRGSIDDIFAYVSSLLKDRSAAEEITALAFERAYRKKRRFKASRGSARAWVFTIARNAALDELRRRKRQEVLMDHHYDHLQLAVEHHIERTVDLDTVRTALREIGEREREIIALKFAGGLSNGEIAEILGTTESNAGTILHRTMRKLRKVCNEVV